MLIGNTKISYKDVFSQIEEHAGTRYTADVVQRQLERVLGVHTFAKYFLKMQENWVKFGLGSDIFAANKGRTVRGSNCAHSTILGKLAALDREAFDIIVADQGLTGSVFNSALTYSQKFQQSEDFVQATVLYRRDQPLMVNRASLNQEPDICQVSAANSSIHSTIAPYNPMKALASFDSVQSNPFNGKQIILDNFNQLEVKDQVDVLTKQLISFEEEHGQELLQQLYNNIPGVIKYKWIADQVLDRASNVFSGKNVHSIIAESEERFGNLFATQVTSQTQQEGSRFNLKPVEVICQQTISNSQAPMVPLVKNGKFIGQHLSFDQSMESQYTGAPIFSPNGPPSSILSPMFSKYPVSPIIGQTSNGGTNQSFTSQSEAMVFRQLVQQMPITSSILGKRSTTDRDMDEIPHETPTSIPKPNDTECVSNVEHQQNAMQPPVKKIAFTDSQVSQAPINGAIYQATQCTGKSPPAKLLNNPYDKQNCIVIDSDADDLLPKKRNVPLFIFRGREYYMSDLDCLKPRRCLTGDVLDLYMKYLNLCTSSDFPDIAFVSPNVAVKGTTLKATPLSIREIYTWVRKTRIHNLKMLVMPVTINSHWVLIVYSITNNCLFYGDSLKMTRLDAPLPKDVEEACFNNIIKPVLEDIKVFPDPHSTQRKLLGDFYHTSYDEEYYGKLKNKMTSLRISIGSQNSDFNCGMFVAICCNAIASTGCFGATPDVSEKMANEFRDVLFELLSNDCKPSQFAIESYNAVCHEEAERFKEYHDISKIMKCCKYARAVGQALEHIFNGKKKTCLLMELRNTVNTLCGWSMETIHDEDLRNGLTYLNNILPGRFTISQSQEDFRVIKKKDFTATEVEAALKKMPKAK